MPAADARVRIRINHNNQVAWFIRMDSEKMVCINDNIRLAALLHRDTARSKCQRLRELGVDARVVSQNGVVLFDEETTPPQADAQREERGPMTVPGSGILIVPGSPSGWFIRFPSTPYESIYGTTPMECYGKLTQHPHARTLIPLAEKYVAPEEPLIDPRVAERAL